MTLKTIAERLSEDGKTTVSKEDMEDSLTNVTHTSLYSKLAELQSRGIITSALNLDTGGSRFYYQGHLIDSVNEVLGRGEYSGAPKEGFETPHDIAVCHATQSVIAWAPSLF